MCPYVAEPATRSTGPKDAIPIASSTSPLLRKKSIARSNVSSGEVVGKIVFRKSWGPDPMPQTNFVPPASMPPNGRIPFSIGREA
jgi:hypothetical protein